MEINGASVPIRWDFETAFRFMEYVDGSEDEDEVFLQRVLEIWYPNVPSDRDAALDAAIRDTAKKFSRGVSVERA